MNEENNEMYRFNDDISFRICSLHNTSGNVRFGNCTNFHEIEENWKTYYYCNQYGIHLHCSCHPNIELERLSSGNLYCPKCNKEIEIKEFNKTIQDCLKILNYDKLKNAKLIRLDDWYVPEITKKEKTESDYWITTNIKQDKDKDTIIVLYIGKKGSKEKAQFFIKPEKLQLTSDHKDLDPATILSKIEITLRGRTITQVYDEKY